MRKMRSKHGGFTILEALVAGGLVMILVVSLLPAFYMLVEKSKSSSFKIMCNSFVRAKLQQYVTGSGAISAGIPGLVPTGFEYTKYRFHDIATNHALNSACDSDPNGTGATTPGFREETSSTTFMNDNATTETTLPAGLKGFQLWVNLRWYNPRVTPPSLGCPTDIEYQFGRIGDAIEVTVTGMIRTEPTAAQGGRGGGYVASGAGAAVGGLRDLKWQSGAGAAKPNPQLMCSVTQTIYPPKIPFRYWMGNDGHIRAFPQTALGTGQSASEPSFQAYFRSIWSTVPSGGAVSDAAIANIVSFSVSPDNSTVYILKPGVLLRYQGCADQNVTVSGNDFKGIPDCPSVPAYQKDISGNPGVPIQSIAVDFGEMNDGYTSLDDTDDIVYMLLNSGPTSDSAHLLQYKVSTDEITENGSYTLPNLPRINGIMLAHTYPRVSTPSMYVMDNTCYFGPAGDTTQATTYCVSLYNSSDAQLERSVTDLPIQVEAISN